MSKQIKSGGASGVSHVANRALGNLEIPLSSANEVVVGKVEVVTQDTGRPPHAGHSKRVYEVGTRAVQVSGAAHVQKTTSATKGAKKHGIASIELKRTPAAPDDHGMTEVSARGAADGVVSTLRSIGSVRVSRLAELFAAIEEQPATNTEERDFLYEQAVSLVFAALRGEAGVEFDLSTGD